MSFGLVILALPHTLISWPHGEFRTDCFHPPSFSRSMPSNDAILPRRKIEESLRQAGHLARNQRLVSFKQVLNEPKFATAVTAYLRARFLAHSHTAVAQPITISHHHSHLPHLVHLIPDTNVRQHGLSTETSSGPPCPLMHHD